MPAPRNHFKHAIRNNERQIGLWVALANPISTELCAGAGFDWLLLDGEHGPNDVRSVLFQLQAIAAYPSQPVVRISAPDAVQVKQMLDIGAQTLLVPMVDTAQQAADMARAARYPPRGTRGIGSALARASGYSAISDYLHTADDEICVLVQAETKKAIENLDGLAATEGVDGVFIGPSDLAADMGMIGQPNAPEIVDTVEHAIARIVGQGKPAGVLATDPNIAKRYLGKGASFVAIGTDVGALQKGLTAVRAALPGGS